MGESDHIFLDNLDGSEFEELCAEIYRRLGYEVENVQDVGDEGRDLILKSPEGDTIVAECKHWPGGSISRPVVQKLHSAVMTSSAKRGLVLTTGSFTKPARDYVEKLKGSVEIELIDMLRLKDLAAKVGIKLVSTDDPVPILSFRIADSATLKHQLDLQVFKQFMSSPVTPENLFTLARRSIDPKPVYLVRYSLRQDFTTSVGLIHRVNVPDALLLVDAETGATFSEGLTTFLQSTAVLPVGEALDTAQASFKKSFKIGAAELKETSKAHIQRLHSSSVSYRGCNNHVYTLHCIPSKRNIFLKDVRQVYAPEQHLEICAIKHTYNLNLFENGQSFYWLTTPDTSICKVCLKSFRRGLLCNSCGATAHPPGLIFPHSFRCKRCKRTLCKRCAYWVRRWFLFKTILCEQCANTFPAGKVRKLTAGSKLVGGTFGAAPIGQS